MSDHHIIVTTIVGDVGEDCCRNCCYSTPLFTLSTMCFIGLGIIGFALAGLYGVAKMDTFPHIQNG